MTILQASSINKTKIKFRWGEPFASEAANVQMGVNLKGAYRGGLVQANVPSANKTFSINTEDGESIIMHRATDGICTVVRETSGVQIDMSARFSDGGAIPAGGETWYVYMDVDYGQNTETEGFFYVNNVAPTDAVTMLAVIEMPAGVTEIESSYIKTDGSKRDKVAFKKEIVVRKKIDVSPSSEILMFQIPDRVRYIEGHDHLFSRVMLVQVDGATIRPMTDPQNGGMVIAGGWYPGPTTAGGPLTDADMDEDGCYDSPWILIGMGDCERVSVDWDFSAIYHACVPFDEWLSSEDDVGFLYGDHASRVWCKDRTLGASAPISLSKGTLSDQLFQLLGFVDDRIKRTYHEGDVDDWTLLWRSHNVTDSNVTNDVISIYFKNSEIMMVVGGFYKDDLGNDVIRREKAEPGSASERMSVIWYRATDLSIWKLGSFLTSVPVQIDIGNTPEANRDWQSVKELDMLFSSSVAYGGSNFNGRERNMYGESGGQEGQVETVMRKHPGYDGSNDYWIPLYEFESAKIGVWWGGGVGGGAHDGLAITFNAHWDSTQGDYGGWALSTSELPIARISKIGGDSLDIANYNRGLGDWENWNTGMPLSDEWLNNRVVFPGKDGTDYLNCARTYGESKKEVIYGVMDAYVNGEGDDNAEWGYTQLNFRNFRDDWEDISAIGMHGLKESDDMTALVNSSDFEIMSGFGGYYGVMMYSDVGYPRWLHLVASFTYE